MKAKYTVLMAVAALGASSIPMAHADSMKQLLQKATGYDNCRPDDQSCKNRAILKGAAAAVAIGIAAKLIYDMVIESKSEQVGSEDALVNEYTKQHKMLPPAPVAQEYDVQALPGNVVKTNTQIKVHSKMAVVPAASRNAMLIEERITIYDNEDHSKALKVTTKAVNEGTKRGGRFTNEFVFAFPEGVPQGVYPIGTELLIDGKPVKSDKEDMQLVMVVDTEQSIRFAAR